MRFYLGCREPYWIGRSPVPLMVSARLPRARFPKRAALNGWFCDSGAFTEVIKHGGWTRTASEHAELVDALANQCPGMEAAAPQDWMCEPVALQATGLSVREHQERTVANFLELREIAPHLPWIPVLQGYDFEEYNDCFELYWQAGIDLRNEPTVGIGSVCRRQNSDEIELIVMGFAKFGLRLHGFGVKTLGLADYGQHLVSADSMAWSHQAWRKNRRYCVNGTHENCRTCYEWAHIWYEGVVRRTRT